MDLTHVELDIKGRLVFHGDCLEMRPVCKAMCCRIPWVVGLSHEEYTTGQFDAEVFCELTNKACRDVSQTCLARRYQL